MPRRNQINQPPLGLTLFALWLVVFGSMSQVLIVAPILPRIGAQFGADAAALGWLLTAYALPISVSTLLAGPVSDRIGRRRILLIGSGALGVALLGHLLARDFAELMAARIIAGICGGLLSGGAFAYITDALPENKRGWATGWVNTGFAGGQILSIPLGSWLALAIDARAAFAVFGVVMLAACALVYWVVPQPPVQRAGRLSANGVLAGYARLWQARDTRDACLTYGALFIAIGVFVPYLPDFLERSAGLTALATALVFTTGGCAMVLAGPRSGRWSDRIGRKPIAAGGTAVVAVCMLAMLLADRWAWAAYVVFALTMAGAASRSGALRTLVSELLPAERRGTLIYVSLALGQLGFAAGSALAGPIYVQFGFVGNAVAGCLVSAAMAGLIWRRLPETLRSVSSPTPARTAEPEQAPPFPNG